MNGGTMTTLLLGEGRGMLPYILDRLYAEKPIKTILGNIFLWNVKTKRVFDDPKWDLVLIGTDEFFSRFLARHGFVIIPEWVMFHLDLTKPLPKGRRNKSLENNLRKVRKYNYTFEITRDPAKFENFYYKMYVPYAKNKYGELSMTGGFRDLWKIYEKGALLLVNRGGDCIAGDLLQIDNNAISARYIGVKDGNIEYLAQGVLAACYYFTITWAKEKGYKWIDFGHCRPFLNDGALYHKKKWGMEIMKSNRRMLATKAVFGMKVGIHQQKILSFLVNNPFVCLDQGKIKGLAFAEQGHPLTSEETQEILNKYYIPGIDCFIISSSQGFTMEAEELASTQIHPRLTLTTLNPPTMH